MPPLGHQKSPVCLQFDHMRFRRLCRDILKSHGRLVASIKSVFRSHGADAASRRRLLLLLGKNIHSLGSLFLVEHSDVPFHQTIIEAGELWLQEEQQGQQEGGCLFFFLCVFFHLFSCSLR